MSAKKYVLMNIGGFLGMNSDAWAEKVFNMLMVMEEFKAYSGLARRDLEAIARGLEEMLGLDYLDFRLSQVRYLGQLLEDAGKSMTDDQKK